MKPKKDLIKAAEADGSIDRLNSLLSAAHILNAKPICWWRKRQT